MIDYEIKEVNLQNLSSSQIESGYILFNDLAFRHWKPLLNAWIEFIKKFCSETNGEAPYIDNEMGNVGLLMSAAWKAGGVAVCEKLVKLKDTNRTARLDLWMKLPECRIVDLIEAKHTNCFIIKKNGKSDKYDYKELKNELNERCKKLDIQDNQRAVSMIFLTYKIGEYEPENNQGLDVEEKIKSFLMEKYQYIGEGWDVLAWCFPEKMRDDKEKMRDDKFPGVILSAKYV